MRILSNELYKLFTSAVFVLTLAVAIIISLYSSATTQIDAVDTDSYKEFFSETLQITDTTEQVKYIEDKLESILNSAEVNIEWRNKVNFYRKQLEQVAAIRDYKLYLENIDKSAETMTSISIFADENSFTYRNIIRTPQAYEGVKAVEPVFSPSEGILLAINNRAIDIVYIFVLIAAVIVLIGKERESGIISLLKPLKNGRKKLSLAKTMTLLLIAVFAGAILFFISLAVGQIRFGLGDLSRPVQSLEGFIGCNLPISVLQMLLIAFVMKACTVFVIAVIFDCLCTKFSVTASIVSLTAIAGIELALYAYVPFSSSAAPFAAINLASFMDSANIMKTYSSINAFGYPLSHLSVTVFCLIIGAALTVLIATMLFSNISITASNKLNLRLPFRKFIPKRAFTYSLYKVMIMHKGALILIAVLAIEIYGAATFQLAYNSDDGYYKHYCDTLSTMDSEQANIYINSEEERFNELLEALSSPDTGANELIEVSRQLNARTGFEQAKEQYNYIANLSSSNKEMFYLSGWNELFGANGYQSDMQHALILIASLCLIILPCLAYDRKCRMGLLIYATKHGKNKYYMHNNVIAAMLGIVISFIVYIPHFYSIFSAYGYDGFGSSIRCLPLYERFADIPIWSYLLILFLARCLIAVLLSILLVWISSTSNSSSTAILIGFILFVLPVLIYLAGYSLAIVFCVPLSISNIWVEMNLAVFANMSTFLALVSYSQIHRLIKK